MKWFKQLRASSTVPIDGRLLMEKAERVADRIGITDFKSSTGWLDRFRKRHGIVYKQASGEAGSVNESTVSDWKKNALPKILKDYKPCDVYNADETSLFYNALPTKTMAFKKDACHGGKQSKARLTVLCCVNEDGTDKLPLLVIGKSHKPRCFKGVRTLPCQYQSNAKGWVTTAIFEKYMRVLDCKMGARNRKIVLLIDNCPAHPTDTSYLRNMKVFFFPPNCTSRLQPLDQGIIKNVKVHYKRQLTNRILSRVERQIARAAGEEVEQGPERKPLLEVLEALHILVSAWALVTPETIFNCFRKSGFRQYSESDSDNEDNIDDEDEEIEEEVLELGLPECDAERWDSISGGMSFSDYVTMDDDVPVCDVQTIDEVFDAEHPVPDDGDSGPEEDNSEAKVMPTQAEALQHWEQVRHYMTGCDLTEEDITLMSRVNNRLYELSQQRVRQAKITSFFQVG